MVIRIISPIAKLFHQFGRRVQNMRWRAKRSSFGGCLGGGLKGLIGCVRFRCGCQINYQAGNSKIALGTAKSLISLPCSQRTRLCLGFGKTNILGRKARQPPQDIMWILTTRQHTRQPIKPGISIRGPQSFMKRRHQIIMLITGAIKSWRPPGNQ